MTKTILPFFQRNSTTFPLRIPHEEAIIWLENPENFTFVRCHLFSSPFRKKKPNFKTSGRMIGYATLDDTASSVDRRFIRRVFYLRADDLRPDCVYLLQNDAIPCEGICPLTISVGWWGE